VCSKEFGRLTPAEQRAASALGYSQHMSLSLPLYRSLFLRLLLRVLAMHSCVGDVGAATAAMSQALGARWAGFSRTISLRSLYTHAHLKHVMALTKLDTHACVKLRWDNDLHPDPLPTPVGGAQADPSAPPGSLHPQSCPCLSLPRSLSLTFSHPLLSLFLLLSLACAVSIAFAESHRVSIHSLFPLANLCHVPRSLYLHRLVHLLLQVASSAYCPWA
jgi:hypothetical protein